MSPFITYSALILLLIAIVIIALLLSKQKKSIEIIAEKKVEQETPAISPVAKEDADKFETEKIRLAARQEKLEEKNKKLFAMSETVYKEKKKVDEQNELLIAEKEKLEIEKKKVDEKIKKLWSQSTAIHKEKERIEKIKIEVEHKHKEIVDSVTYAKRIQDAILPNVEEISTAFPQSFVLFKPKDIVAGDFYWFHTDPDGEGTSFIAAADCTGHGVPGAFMSMLGSDKLNDSILHSTDVSKILQLVNLGMKKALRQTDKADSTRDGMDIALCSFNKELTQMSYTAANRPLWIIRNGKNEVEETKATKTAIGGLTADDQEFTKHTVNLNKGDFIYIFTDGYADQFSPDDKKLMTRKFKEVLLSIQHLPMTEQGVYLEKFIDDWKVNTEQTDDVLVIGIKI